MSDTGQHAIAAYRVEGRQLFFPDALASPGVAGGH
jgi:ABC-type tungstate transport system permease subunit